MEAILFCNVVIPELVAFNCAVNEDNWLFAVDRLV